MIKLAIISNLSQPKVNWWMIAVSSFDRKIRTGLIILSDKPSEVAMHYMHSIMHTPHRQSTAHRGPCILLTKNSALQTTECKPHTWHWKLHTAPSTLYDGRSKLHTVHCTQHSMITQQENYCTNTSTTDCFWTIGGQIVGMHQYYKLHCDWLKAGQVTRLTARYWPMPPPILNLIARAVCLDGQVLW